MGELTDEDYDQLLKPLTRELGAMARYAGRSVFRSQRA